MFLHIRKLVSLFPSQSFLRPPNPYRTAKCFGWTLKALYIKHSSSHSREWICFIHTNLLSCPKTTVCCHIFHTELMPFSLPCSFLKKILLMVHSSICSNVTFAHLHSFPIYIHSHSTISSFIHHNFWQLSFPHCTEFMLMIDAPMNVCLNATLLNF